MMKRILFSGLLAFFTVALFAQTQVGYTTYDLQTNTTVCRRVATNAAGEVVISYTRSHAFSEAAPDRGTGYNYWDGSVWSEPDFTTPGTFTRADVGRTGWSNVGIIESLNREIVVSHFADNGVNFGGIQVQYRNLGSAGAWTTVSLNASVDPTWPRMAISGDSIIIISSAQIGTFNNGVDGGIYLHRSFDGGVTWNGQSDPSLVQPEAIDVISDVNFNTIGADVYAIDADDNGNVSIVIGPYQTNLITSSDFGATWTLTPIHQTYEHDNPNQVNPNNFGADFGETMDTTDIADQAYSCVIDDNGVTHVWYGRQQSYKDDPNAQGAFYFPLVEGLMYWNSTMTTDPILLHETRFTAEQVELCFSSMFLATPVIDNNNQPNLYGSSYTSQPSGAFGDNGDLYVVYSALRSPTIDLNTGAATDGLSPNSLGYRDIFMLKSSDNGVTWEGPLNVSDEYNRECAYPGIPRKVYGGMIPTIWQEDENPGTALQAPAGISIPYTDNEINFVMVDAANIVAPVDITCPTIASSNAAPSFTVLTGCPPDETSLNGVIVVDDVPQGPDYDMLQTTGVVDYSTPGVYTVGLYAADDAGNSSDTINTTITVVADNTPPVVDLIGPDTLAVVAGSTYTDPGITFSDNGCDPSAAPMEVDGVNPAVTVGTYGTYTYTVTDNSGNPTTVIRYVEIVAVDAVGPEVLINGTSPVTIEACEGYNDEGAAAFDNVDFDVTASIVATITPGGSVDVNTPGTYTITYTAMDAAGNTGTATRIVTVADNTAPELTVTTENGVVYQYLGDPYAPPVATATDCVDNAPVIDDNGSAVVNDNAEGTYVVTMTATDFSMNESSEMFNVVVGTEPTADFLITQAGTTVILTNASTPNTTFWSWDYGDGSPNAQGANPPSHVYTEAGDYMICLTARNRFNDAPFSKPESVVCKSVTIVTGIADRNKLDASVEVYPNPSNGLISVNVEDIQTESLTITVTNIIGEVIATTVKEDVKGSTNATFDLENNASGIYFINIATEDASISKKVMIK